MKSTRLCLAVLALFFLPDAGVRRAHAQAAGDNPLHPSIVLKIGSEFLRHSVAQSAAYSPDGTLLATGGMDVRLWDVKAKKLLKVMPLPGETLAILPQDQSTVLDMAKLDKCK